jgi:hypothetical protein
MMNLEFQLKGKLADFRLPEIVQLLHLGRKSGELALFADDHAPAGSIFLIQGELVHAVLGESRGVAAFSRIMMLDRGYFTFLADRISRELTIERPIEALLMEAHARHDELVRFRAELPPPDTVLSIAGGVADVPRLSGDEWQVLSLVNGRRTIGRIVDKTGDELAALSALHSLLAKGLLRWGNASSPLEGLVPLPLPAAQTSRERPYPPRLRTNLLLKAINGHTTLGCLARDLRMDMTELVEDIQLLLELKWVSFGAGHEETWQHWVNDPH